MTCQLPFDCLNDIFKCLEEDKHTLYSCLLVNHLWCEVSVRIIWGNIWNIRTPRNNIVSSSILSTLVACLPNESKELLCKNEIFILTPTPKLPLFNYTAFCKILPISSIDELVVNSLQNKKPSKKRLVKEEIIKMFANQVYPLKKLFYYNNYYPLNFSFPYFPGLRDLSELYCSTILPSNFYYQLSQICCNLHTLSIIFDGYATPNELKELISLQNNLKVLILSAYDNASWKDIIPALKNNSNTITKLRLYGNKSNLPFSFVGLFYNLQEFIFSFMNVVNGNYFEGFKSLQYVNFSNLQTLKFPYHCPRPEYVMEFLETNGKNLKKFYVRGSNKALRLSIADFCPNLRSLFIVFNNNEIDILKVIFNNCEYLESIKVWCGKHYLSEKKVFETVANYSPNNFYELKIDNISHSDISPEDLEPFFISWKNRITKRILSLIIIKEYCKNLDDDEENMEIIKKYENLGIIRFRTIGYEKEKDEENYFII
ncbi:hypothetical protein RclHR1_11640003 [Rhizophagus clarus]|uniref:F-box domain-containing protein n=1 Tax=Rhizophagus clarus TaxID=94130 RepID=A0A2Z6Q672_9GLOM|nr:hypothetical protein RclHR1_11640003 [Rhizophagus clarus]GES99290.1 hypothetical protein GLOIN_2v1784405 [Rhizophagus clarus]